MSAILQFKISLYNSIGQELRVVTDKELSGNENNHVVEMDLGSLKPGAYYLKLEAAGKTMFRKLIKS